MTNPTDAHIEPDIGAYNDAIAGMYDAATKAEGWSINELLQGAAGDDTATIESVLDLGAGTGQTIAAIQEFCRPMRIVAVDASAKMLRRLHQQHPDPTIETVHRQIEDFVPTCHERFDLVTAMGSLEFVRDLPTVIANVVTLLRSNGRLMLTYIERTTSDLSERTFPVAALNTAFTEYYWPKNALQSVLESQGLTITHTETFPAYTRADQTVEYTFLTAVKS